MGVYTLYNDNFDTVGNMSALSQGTVHPTTNLCHHHGWSSTRNTCVVVADKVVIRSDLTLLMLCIHCMLRTRALRLSRSAFLHIYVLREQMAIRKTSRLWSWQNCWMMFMPMMYCVLYRLLMITRGVNPYLMMVPMCLEQFLGQKFLLKV